MARIEKLSNEKPDIRKQLHLKTITNFACKSGGVHIWGECNDPQHVHHLCCGVCVGVHCQRVRISAASSTRMRRQFQLLVRVDGISFIPLPCQLMKNCIGQVKYGRIYNPAILITLNFRRSHAYDFCCSCVDAVCHTSCR